MRLAGIALLVLSSSLVAHGAALPAFDVTDIPQHAGVGALKLLILNSSMTLDIGLRTRQLSSDNPQNPARCPGGSIGGADSCTFQPIAMFDDRDNFYEEYQLDSYNNCGGGVPVTFTANEQHSYEVSTTVSVTSGASIGSIFGISVEGGWSQTVTQGVTIERGTEVEYPPNYAGGQTARHHFQAYVGTVGIWYPDRVNDHYLWFAPTMLTVFVPTDTERANDIGQCVNGQPPRPFKPSSVWKYDDSVLLGELRNDAGFTLYDQSDAEAYHRARHDGDHPSDPSEHRDGGFCGLYSNSADVFDLCATS